MGQNVSINENVYIQAAGGVTIGDRVTLSRNVMILTCGLETKNYIHNASKVSRDHITKSVDIGEGTWLAAGTIVCPGATIARNCIVSAGSVVTKSLTTENALYGGNPARFIKTLVPADENTGRAENND